MSSDSVALRRSLDRYKGLVEVSALINSITDFDELLRAILNVAREVLEAEAASLFFLDEPSGDLELVIASSERGEFRKPLLRVPRGRGIVGSVWASGKPELVVDVYKDARFYREADQGSGFRTRSVICTPLSYRDKRQGVLEVLNPARKTAFEPDDLEALVVYGNLIASAIEKLRALAHVREQERMEHELGIAGDIQREILANAVPEQLDAVVFACFNEPARDIGGDFYHVARKDRGEVCFALGDVCGKGMPAALLMAQILSALEFVVRSTARPSLALARANTAVHSRVVRGMFATLLVGRMLPAQRRIEIAGAGHCRPLVVGGNREPREVPLPGALPVGVFPDVRYTQRSVTLVKDEFLLLFSDGLSESTDAQTGVAFEECFKSVLKKNYSGPREIIDQLVEAERRHRGDAPRADDLTLVATGFK